MNLEELAHDFARKQAGAVEALTHSIVSLGFQVARVVHQPGALGSDTTIIGAYEKPLARVYVEQRSDSAFGLVAEVVDDDVRQALLHPRPAGSRARLLG